MAHPRRAFCTLAAVIAIALPSAHAWSAQRESGDDKKPSLALRANPPVGFSPLRVRLVVDARGGSDDYADFYCPTIEWDWGDDTRAESTSDCEPYQEGKTEIRRRDTVSRIFQSSGSFKVAFRLKQNDKVVGSSTTTVQVRPGLRDGGMCCEEERPY
jgi:hypothetical protein